MNWNKTVAEETLKELNRLKAKVENTDNIGYELSCILNTAIQEVEKLLESEE